MIIMFWSSCISNYSSCQNKPKYSMYSTIIASILHFFLAPLLAVQYDMRMLGISYATFIHFFVRFLVNYILFKLDKDL